MKKQYQVHLSDRDRKVAERLITAARKAARKALRAKILLLADAGKKDQEIADALKTSLATVVRIRTRFVKEGLSGSLEDKPRSGKPPKLNSKLTKQIISLSRSKPPTGKSRWSLRLLAEKAIEMGLVDTISHETIREILLRRAFI